MKIAVLGATGVLGRGLVMYLAEKGHEVRALARTPEKATALRHEHVQILPADLFDVASLETGLEGCEIAVNTASAVPRPGNTPLWDTNTRIRTEGTRNVIAAARNTGVGIVVHQSVAMVHQSVGGTWVDEDSPLVETTQTRSAIDLERIVTDENVGWKIVRGGLFYGPGTGREDYYRAAAKAGKIRLPGNGSDFISLIHIDDMVTAMAAIIESGSTATTWLAVDDRPVTWRTFLSHLCIIEDRPLPTDSEPNSLLSFRCRNDRLRTLGWSPRFPSFTDGIT